MAGPDLMPGAPVGGNGLMPSGPPGGGTSYVAPLQLGSIVNPAYPVQSGIYFGPTGYATAFAPTPPPFAQTQQPQPQGLAGFFVNAWRDAHTWATGLSALAGMGSHDLLKAGEEGISLGQWGHQMGGYDITPGRLWQGIDQAFFTKNAWNFYDHPLNVLSNILTVLSLGGGALGLAARTAGMAGLAGEVTGDTAAEIAAKAASGAGTVAGQANLADQIGGGTAAEAIGRLYRAASTTENRISSLRLTGPALERAQQELGAYRSAMSDLQSKFAPAWAQALQPGIGTPFPGGSKFIRVGDEFVKVPLASNVWKQLVQTSVQRLLTQSPDKLGEQIALLGQDGVDAQHLQGIVDQARALGTNVEREGIATRRLSKAVDTLVGNHTSRFLRQRGEDMAAMRDALSGVPEPDLSSMAARVHGLQDAVEAPPTWATWTRPAGYPDGLGPIVSDPEMQRLLEAGDRHVAGLSDTRAPLAHLDQNFDAVSAELYRRLKEFEGATYDPRTGRFFEVGPEHYGPGEPSVAVGGGGGHVPDPADLPAFQAALRDFVSHTQDLLEQGRHIGVWSEGGKTYLDPSLIVRPDEAMGIAARNGEIAAYDLRGDRNLYTPMTEEGLRARAAGEGADAEQARIGLQAHLSGRASGGVGRLSEAQGAGAQGAGAAGLQQVARRAPEGAGATILSMAGLADRMAPEEAAAYLRDSLNQGAAWAATKRGDIAQIGYSFPVQVGITGPTARIEDVVNPLAEMSGPSRIQAIAQAQREVVSSLDLSQGTVDHLASDGALPVVRVKLATFRDAEAALAKLRETFNVEKVDDTLVDPRSMLNRGVHVLVRLADQTPVQVELHDPVSVLAAQVADSSAAWVATAQEAMRVAQAELDAGRVTGEEATRLAASIEAMRHEITLAGYRHGSLMEPVVMNLRREFLGQAPEAGAWAQERLRLEIAKRLEEPEIAGGFTTPSRLFARQYLAQWMASGGEFTAKGERAGGAEIADLHLARQAANLPTPIYFPHMDATRVKFSDFLMSKRAIGARAAKAAVWRRPDLGKLLEAGKFVTDPIDAYTRRAAMAVAHQETWDMVREFVNRFGRPIDPLHWREELRPGERLVAPDGLLRFFNYRLYLDDAITKAVANDGEKLAPATLKALQNVLPEVQDATVAEIRMATQRGVKMYAAPEAAVNRLEAHVMPRLGVKTRLFWDGPTNLWRNMVLLGSPRWFVNVFFGNVLFLKAQGGRMSDVVLQLLRPGWRETLDEKIPAEVLNNTFMGANQQYQTHLGAAGETTIGQYLTTLKATRPMRFARSWGSWYGKQMLAIEDAYRRASWLAAARDVGAEAGVLPSGLRAAAERWVTLGKRLDQLSEVGADPALAQQIGTQVNRFMGEYDRLSPIERNVIRRWVMPFYGFYKHMLKAFAVLPFTQPQRFDVLRAMAEMGQEFTSQYGPVPAWLQGDVAYGAGYAPGTTRFLSTSSLNPFAMLFQDPLSMLNPWIQTVFEEVTGRNFNTMQPFTSANTFAAPGGSDQMYRMTTSGQIEPVTMVQPSILELALRNIPQYTLLEQMIAGAKTYDTSTLLGDIANRSGSVITNPITQAPQQPYDLAQRIMGFIGAPSIDYSLIDYQQSMQMDRAQALLYYLERQGLLPPQGLGQVSVPLPNPLGLQGG